MTAKSLILTLFLMSLAAVAIAAVQGSGTAKPMSTAHPDDCTVAIARVVVTGHRDEAGSSADALPRVVVTGRIPGQVQVLASARP